VLQHLQDRRQDEKGFTLIELMVVVLIMGILMAIAIPTFLSTRNSANDSGAKSNATNAFTNEKSYYATDQLFIDTPLGGNGAALDSSLPWDTTPATFTTGEAIAGDVSAFTISGVSLAGAEVTATPYQGSTLVVEALSKANNCFYIIDNEAIVGSSFIGYAETSGGCAAGTKVFVLNAAPAAGSASAHTIPLASVGPATVGAWYQSW
jgi:prepilin-type N-terminal cleavage/methylation domain-containing protein